MYREEYPRPSFVREKWLNLNGSWDFQIGDKDPNKDYISDLSEYNDKIEVPFCPESKLSGIENRDFMRSVWYKRTFSVSREQLFGKVLINFGAVDYEADVYINGVKTGTHKGGYCSFSFDITEFLREGENTVVVNAKDDNKNTTYPSGKQSEKYESEGCMYTRTTGIWQTVWLEFVNDSYIKTRKITPDASEGVIRIEGTVENPGNCEVLAEVYYKGEKKGEGKTAAANRGSFDFKVSVEGEIKRWDVLAPEIYDITLKVIKYGETADEVKTYTGFRTIELKDGKFLLNGKPVFLRQVLDQGFHPDGVYTFPCKEDIEKDIDLAIEFGFNGARPHQKVFEELYLYYADMKGYLIWGEFPNWGCLLNKKKNPKALKNFLDEWKEVLVRDYNHPSIIGWCPLNETWGKGSLCDSYSQKAIYSETKKYDPIRPAIGSSGGYLYVTDIDDFHDYNADAEVLKERVFNHNNGTMEEKKLPIHNKLEKDDLLTRRELKGLPVFLSEYGGISFKNDDKVSWGYVKENNEEDFLNRYTAETSAILESGCIGMCYTQLTDVEQEQNGLVTYDRRHKFSEEARKKIRECNSKKAKIEE